MARQAAERTAAELRESEAALRSSESRFRRLANSNLVGVIFCDIRGEISWGNSEAFRILGHPPGDFLSGRIGWGQLTPPEYAASDERAIRQLKATGVATPFEKEFIRKDGTRIAVLIAVAMLEASASECVALLIDLTERKRYEAELRIAKETAEAANAAKDRFLAVLSHELRTPLTPVLALAGLSERDLTLTDEQREDWALVRRNIHIEARLIEDLLDVTRISRGKLQLQLETLDAHKVIREALELASHDEAQPNPPPIRTELLALEHHVRADEARLQQIVWNLVKNALKFTPSGGQVLVSTSNDEGQLRIIVSDTGIGIESSLLPTIFDAFEQGERTRQFGGLGLGLAIARGLTRAMGGSIHADSRGHNRGATFTVILPACRAPQGMERPEAQLQETEFK
jgi:PAS domain S-box-containing protein